MSTTAEPWILALGGTTHRADVVTDHLLPAVGVAFALYLTAAATLALVTVALKLSRRAAAHRAAHAVRTSRVGIPLPAARTAGTAGAPPGGAGARHRGRHQTPSRHPVLHDLRTAARGVAAGRLLRTPRRAGEEVLDLRTDPVASRPRPHPRTAAPSGGHLTEDHS
ncbi:hypothetical protein [Kineococcus sp. SYSU DK004]|uniref:hypothetical protein n=1 Tax=Kineococcus sp. SYSU DK004 TaxID=3383125 RepID=UPI003D7D5AA6